MPVNQRSNPEPKRGICMMHARMIDYCVVISFSPIYCYLLDQLISKISDLLLRVLDYLGLVLL